MESIGWIELCIRRLIRELSQAAKAKYHNRDFREGYLTALRDIEEAIAK